MTGEELYRLRKELGDTIGQDISFTDMAKLCGLAPKNGADTIRKWEAGEGPSGPVAALLSILAYASLKTHLPDELLSAGADMLHPNVLDADERLISDSPAQIAESVFREMILTEVRRRLS